MSYAGVFDRILGTYGRLPLPHKGRDRIVSFLERRARMEWKGIRRYKRNGIVLESDFSTDDVSWTLYSYGCLDYWDELEIRRRVGKGSTRIDAGAHIGYYSLLLSRQVGAEGRIISFEPVPSTYQFLQRNLLLNGASNVHAVRSAVGDKAGPVPMRFGKGLRMGWSSVDEAAESKVPCTTIDSETVSRALQKVDFIKIDVEGYEPNLLRGASKTIKDFRPTLMLEVNAARLRSHGSSPSEVLETLQDLKYGVFQAEKAGMVPLQEFPVANFYNV
ncbi:MAG: FkbM family methyltransferase [Terriglobia bacterium]